MRIFAVVVIVAMVAILFGAYFYIHFGYAPVATAAAPLPMEKWLAQAALQARVEREAPKQAPSEPTSDDFAIGAGIYREQCAVCHGLPGNPETAIAKGMFPQPPQLFRGRGVTGDPVGETWWKVENGIRLSGMPAFKQSLTESQIWQVSQTLAHAGNLPPAVQQSLQSPMKVE
jgi:thiosulfate dehydrogenase